MALQYWRWLILGVLLAVMLGVRAPDPSNAQTGLLVATATATYPGAPRSVQILDVTLPSGQHVWFDRDLCRTFAWKDSDGTDLAAPVSTGSRWPIPDIQLTHNGAPYSDTVGGLWASEWGGFAQPHFQGFTTTATSFTATCDHPATDGTRYTAAIIYTNIQRDYATGFSLSATVTPQAGVGGLGGSTQLTGLGAVGGSSVGLVAWDFDGDGYGVRAYPHGASGGYALNIWAILTHPQGVFVLSQPNLYDPGAFGQWSLSSGVGFTAARATATVGDPVRFLWAKSTRAVPQKYLDMRYALYHEWQATLGLGPQHSQPAREGGGGGRVPFTTLNQLSAWQGDGLRPLDWGARFMQWVSHLSMYATTNGQASGINGAHPLQQDMFLPDVSDLPGLLPAPNGQAYTMGTLAQFREAMDLQRILGVTATFWSQWFYETCDDVSMLSHYNLSSHSSGYHTLHPDLIAPCSNIPNYDNPAVFTEMRDRHRMSWIDYGMQGKFMDSDHQIPFAWTGWWPAMLDFYVWYARQGGYIMGEVPDSFLSPLYYNNGAAYAISGREWGAPFAVAGTRPRTCLGVDGVGLNRCQEAVGYIGATTGTRYDPASARRLHMIGGASGVGGLDNLQGEQAQGAAHVAAVQAEMKAFGAMQDRYGLPDRVELINPTQVGAHPWPALLSHALGVGASPTYGYEPGEVVVMPGYALSQAGTIQIDSERIRYTASQSDSGLNAGNVYLTGVTRGADGTTATSHALGTTVTAANDPLHWTFDDAYWVYGTGENARWVRYSDGSVWQPGGSVAAALPGVTNVSVAAGGSSSATITYTTDAPATSWIEYDTYGSAEPYNDQRPAGWWPNYLRKTNMQDVGAPALATTHSRALPNLTPGALYHYSIVTRPGERTSDATFVAGAQAPTYSISASPNTVAPGGTVTLTIHDGAPADWHAWGRVNQTTNEWGFLSCGQTGPNPPGVTDAVCQLPAPTTPGTYTYGLFDSDPARTVLATSNPIIVAAAPTNTPTRTATLTATRTSTATATRTSTPTATATPRTCILVYVEPVSAVSTPCP